MVGFLAFVCQRRSRCFTLFLAEDSISLLVLFHLWVKHWLRWVTCTIFYNDVSNYSETTVKCLFRLRWNVSTAKKNVFSLSRPRRVRSRHRCNTFPFLSLSNSFFFPRSTTRILQAKQACACKPPGIFCLDNSSTGRLDVRIVRR